MRLHGDREPRQPQQGTTGGATCCSGADNEVWSYGPKVYEICKKYMSIREQLRDYTRGIMEEAHIKGTPVIRPCFYSFPADKKSWEVYTQYMYGDKYLCCPVLAPGLKMLDIYLPAGAEWKSFAGETKLMGGQMVQVECPLDVMPVFVRQQ